MRSSMHDIIPQETYRELLVTSEQLVGEVKKSLTKEQQQKVDLYKSDTPNIDGLTARELVAESKARTVVARDIIKGMAERVHGQKGLAKAGVTSSLGFNFYDLRAPVLLSYPVNVPFRNMLPRIGRVNDGVGVAAHWKATRNPGFVYAGSAEGQRTAVATPDDIDYVASYKELGVERAVTFTAQFAGEGFADNVADEHIRGLHELWLQEEGIMVGGNSGTATGNNGFVLGTAPTPTGTGSTTGGALPNGSTVSAAVVLLTALGNPQNTQYGYGIFPTVAGGLTPSYTRNNADGSTTVVNGGMSAISAMSTVTTTTGTTGSVKYVVANYPKGTFGFAWFVNTTDASAPTLANARLAAITQFPSYVVTAAATGTQAGNATGLNTDHSFNTLDFDGLLTYAASTAGAYWKDMAGASFVSNKDGSVAELEDALQYIWTQYQAAVTTIWADASAAKNIDRAVRWSGTQSTAQQIFITKDEQNNMMGGFVVSAYQSRYSMNPTGAAAIPIRIHPMMPFGTIYLDVADIPYPSSRAPYSRGMLVQREYYSIEWPIVTRSWTFGTYVHEVLAHNFPWIPGVITGIGTFVGT